MFEEIRPLGLEERPFYGVEIAEAKACGISVLEDFSDMKEKHDEESSGISCVILTLEQRS